MTTSEHQRHLDTRTAHNNCDECRADCERQFAPRQWPGYQHVGEYLSWARPRIAAIRGGQGSGAARYWYWDFRLALHRRISTKVTPPTGRKHSPGYLERMRIATGGRNADAAYLRGFAARGASTLTR